MRVVWRDGLKTVAEVTERVNRDRDRQLDYRTILSVMSHLVKKKLLRHRRHGNTYHFSVTCSEEEFAHRQGAEAVAGLFDRYGEPAVAGILEQLAATPELRGRLESLMTIQDRQTDLGPGSL